MSNHLRRPHCGNAHGGPSPRQFVAAATPKDVVAQLHAALVTVLQSADTKQRFASQGANAVSSTPEELATFMREETIKWGKVIKTSGIKIDQ